MTSEPEKNMWAVLRRVGPAFAVGLMYAAIVTARSIASFPFARTLISCGKDSPANIDRDSSDWSGSQFCNDKTKVVDDATFVRGFGQGIDYVVQCLFVPILSNLSDSYGRRPMAMIGVLGLVLSALFFYLASLTTSVPWYMIATTVQGATAVVTPLMSTVSVDGAITDAQKGAAFGAYAGATLIVLVVVVVIVTLVVVMPNPYNYQPFYLILFSLSVLLLGHTWSYYPETATMRKPWDKVNWFPLRVYRIFLQNRNLGWLAIALFLLGFAVGSINVLQGFVVRSYGWSNAESIYVFVLALAVLAISCVCGPVVISAVGTHTALKIGISLVIGGFCVLIFAQAAPVLVYIGILIMAAGGFASPAFLTIISSLAHHSDQGLLQGAVNSVVLLSSGIGSAVHSATFSWARTTSVGASLPFLVSAVCVAVALAITVWVLRSLQRGRRGSDSALPIAPNAQVLMSPSIEMVPTASPRTAVQPTDLEPFQQNYDTEKLPSAVSSDGNIERV